MTTTKTELWWVESWDEHNREPGHFLGAAGWCPAGHTHRTEERARAWAEVVRKSHAHYGHPDTRIRIIHRTTTDEVTEL